MSDKDINNTTDKSLTEDEKKAWIKLWLYANNSISEDGHKIQLDEFIKYGKDEFQIKLKSNNN